MSVGILIDWSGTRGRALWHVWLTGLPATLLRPAGPSGRGSGAVDSVAGRSVGAGDGGSSDEAVARFPSPPSRLLRLDRLALELRVAHDRLVQPLARVAAAFLGARAWRPCGAARLEDHARERFGRTARWVRQYAELGGALARWPELARALTGDDGGVPLGAEAARLVARVMAAGLPAGTASGDGADLGDGSDSPGRDSGNASNTEEGLLARWIERAREVPLRVLRAEWRAALSTGAGHAGAAVVRDAEATVEDGATGTAAVDRLVMSDPDPDTGARCIVEFRLPAAIHAAFDEVVDLHRALAGYDGSLGAAVDALIAEAMSSGLASSLEYQAGNLGASGTTAARGAAGARVATGAHLATGAHVAAGAPDAVGVAAAWRCGSDALGLARRPAGCGGTRGRTREAREARLERVTGRWAFLPSPYSAGPDSRLDDLLRRAASSLSEFRLLAACAGYGGPLVLDDQLHRLVALEDALMRRLGEIALEFSRRGAWATLGFSGIGHYAEARLGLPATVLEDRVVVARRLAGFPRLRDAYERGRLGLDALLVVLRTLGRGPVPDDVEQAWLARAREATVKRLRDEARAVARRALEPAPAAEEEWAAEGCPVSGARLASVAAALPAEARAPVVAAPPSDRAGWPLPLGDSAWAASLHRVPGLARRRVLQAGLLALEPSPDVFLRLHLPESLADDLLAAVEAARRGLTALADSVPWHQPWPDDAALPSLRAARMFSVRARRVPAWVGLLALLEEAACAWDDPRACPQRAADPIYRRDGYRCTAPGCTARATIEEHHVVFRSRGGSDALDNRIALCAAHHAALHEHGTLAVTGRAPLGLTWRVGTAPAGRRYRCERRLSDSNRLAVAPTPARAVAPA